VTIDGLRREPQGRGRNEITAPGYIDVLAVGTMCFQPGSRLDPLNLHTLTLGANAYQTTEMDLRGAEIVGGTFRMHLLPHGRLQRVRHAADRAGP
jgi:hypothetical protein